MTQTKKPPVRFGEKLRAVRERKGYTLKVVAQRAGVSESLVSQIERNKVSPAIDTLLVLADVLDINLEFLFEEYRRERPVQIIHAQERRTMEEESAVYEELSKPANDEENHSLESYLVRLPPNGKTLRGSYGHLGREMGFIIKGRAQLHYDDNIYELEEGDSVSYSASAPHTIVNVGEEPLTALWVVTPAHRFI